MSHGDCAVFVVVVERWKRKVGGGWIVGFFFFFRLLWRFLELEFVGVVAVDVVAVAVVDDRGEEIIYYFNV